MISAMVMVPTQGAALAGDLVVSGPVRSVVLFVHGNGSSRHSQHNRVVAAELRKAGLGTLLLDLLTEREERADALTAEHRFDITLLAGRLVDAIDWLDGQPDTAGVPVGLLGAGTGAAAAMVAATERPERVSALVSRSGRPDLAGDAPQRLSVPVLLVVGGNDTRVLELNRAADKRITAPHKLHVVRGATDLLDDPEALDQVAQAARDWFLSGVVARGRAG
jgi:putative phosphoribosyl transferase